MVSTITGTRTHDFLIFPAPLLSLLMPTNDGTAHKKQYLVLVPGTLALSRENDAYKNREVSYFEVIILRDNIQGITKPAIRRLARRGGVKRISGLIYERDTWCSQSLP